MAVTTDKAGPDPAITGRVVPGQVIRGYELRNLVGKGGFGAVYLAYQAAVDREVAIKIIRPEYANHPDFIRRFEAEAHLIARLEHPHIVPLYDYWREPDSAYLVMRWLRAGSLRASLLNGPWELEAIGFLLDQVAAALSIAHRSGIVHQDVKPSNILLDEHGNAYLTDFGIAKDLLRENPPGSDTASFGSPAYMAPETILHEPITAQADVYSLGIVLYEMLTGRVPFVGADTTTVMRRHVNDPVPPLQFARPDLSNDLNIVIRRATAKTSQARYADPLAMAAEFHQVAMLGANNRPTRRPLAPLSPLGGDGAVEMEEVGTLPLTVPLEPENPYKGLRPFDEADAIDYFGREQLVKSLLDHLAGTDMLARFLAVVGPSGSGKSSLVNAGLLPAIREGYLPGSSHWYIAKMTPGGDPLQKLEEALLRIAAGRPADLTANLRTDEHGLTRIVDQLLPDDDTHLLLVVDQFEEVFGPEIDEKARAHLLNLLYTAVAAREGCFHLIITLRADFYDRPFLYPGFGDLVRWCTEIVMPLSSTDLVRVIVRPAERLGLEVEEELVTAIVADVNEQPGALPLLQYALTELFERHESNTLTLRAYRETGGVLGALARRADELFTSLDPAGEEAARQMFMRLVAVDGTAEDTRRRARWAELKGLHRHGPAAMQTLVDRFGRFRLLTFDRDPQTREPTVEVAHEALIREWERLHQWLNEYRADLLVQRRLSAAMDEWKQSGRDSSYLARGARLAEFETLVARKSLALNEDERAFVKVSGALRRRSSLIVRAVGVVLLLFSLLALTLALAAFDGQQRAGEAASIARSRELAVTGLTNVEDTDLALLLSLQALRAANTYEARNSLLSAIEAHPFVEHYLVSDATQIRAVAYSPDGRWIAAAAQDGRLLLWDADGQPLSAVDAGHADWINGLAFSQDGTQLATASRDDTVRLWAFGEDGTLTLTHTLTIGSEGVWAVAFSPDGGQIVAGGMNGLITLWNTQSGQPIDRTLIAHTDIVFGLAYSPDGRVLASASADDTVQLWNMRTREPEGPALEQHHNWVMSVAFSPDGHLLASGDADGVIYLWNVEDPGAGRPLGTLSGHNGAVRGLAFSPDGTHLTSAGEDGLLREWDTTSGREIARLTGHRGPVWSLAYSPDGQAIVSGGVSGEVILWHAEARPVLGTPLPQTEALSAVEASLAISPDGRRLVMAETSAEGDNTIQIWNLADEQRLQLITTGDAPTDVAFSQAQNMLAVAFADAVVRVWHVTDDAATLDDPIAELTDPGRAVFSVAFSPDGRLLAGGLEDGRLILWDTTTWLPVVAPLAVQQGAIFGLAFSPDGQFLASASGDTTVVVWDVARRRPVGDPLTGHQDGVERVAFSPDGRLLASAGRDGLVLLWDVTTRQLVTTLSGHTDYVNGLAFSPDGRLLASADEDGAVRLWDVAAGRPLGGVLSGHVAPVGDLAFAPSGTRLASVGLDGTVIVWDVSLEGWQARACAIANRNLDTAEWDQFFPGDPYEFTCPNVP